MLHDLERLGRDFQNRFNDIKIWPEIKFSDEDKLVLSKLSAFSQINDSTIQIETSDTSHCIIPSQYFLYAVLIKEFALALKEYTNIIDTLRSAGSANSAWDAISTEDLTNPTVSSLDTFSKKLVYKPFRKGNCILGAKDILNGSVSDKKLRGTKDFFGSVILKVINVPDVSSSEVGKLIYELATKKDIYDYLEKQYLRQLPFICFEKSIGEFVRSVLGFLYQYDGLRKLKDLIKPNHDARYQSIELNEDKLTSIFFVSIRLANAEDLIRGGTKRFFEEPIAILDGNYIYLSTQWTNVPDGSRLDLNLFKRIIEQIYPDFMVQLDGRYVLKTSVATTNSVNASNGKNIIYYGAPGTGKSHSVDAATDENKTIRTIFHADTQYSDFVGCLKPTTNGTDVTYTFRPGPFSVALVNALNDADNHYWLVVEEINRAPAAAAFGEIFQLLDRDVTGKSKYPITPADPDMIIYVESALGKKIENGKIYIPKNLSILATMNSSDQAVMPLDTAFKRRWRFKYIPLDFNMCARGSLSLTLPTRGEVNVEWKHFATTVNNILSDLEIPEDRHLGPFFLNDQELKDTDSQNESLTGKLFMYLWDDVLRHGYRSELFRSDIKTYGQLTYLHLRNEQVFSDRFYSALEGVLTPSSVVAIENIGEGEIES
jgi:hypothetical protein